MHEGIDDFDMPAPAEVRRAADALRMLADPTRLSILWALMQGETSVACLAELSGTTPTAVSQHLSKLRLAGLVTNRRERNFIFYGLADQHIGELVRQALSHADHSAGRNDSAGPSSWTNPPVVEESRLSESNRRPSHYE